MSNHAVVTAEDLPGVQGPSAGFVDESYLTYLIPSETDIDLEKSFEALSESKTTLGSIHTRDTLFFDETVDVLLVLKTPWIPKRELDYHIGRLAISLEAHIVNASVPGRESPNASETIFSGRLQDTKDPFIVVYGDDSSDAEDEEGSSRQIYAIWKLPVFLARPRMRLHSPSVVFSASASLRPDTSTEPHELGAGYLSSGLPSGLNLLDSFANDPSLNGVTPRLSALRVSRVAPVTRQKDLMARLRALPQLSVSIFPVLHTRIRFSRPNTTPLSPAIIAFLEVDFTSHFTCEALLDEIQLSAADCTVEHLNDEASMKLPLSCVSHDHVTFLYRIKPHYSDASTARDTAGTLNISISATVNVVPQMCTPRLSMSWTSNLDFSSPVNPNFGPAAEPGIQRSHRPAQLSIGGSQAVTPLKSPSTIRPDALPGLEASTNRTETPVPDLGITMSFTAPPGPVHPGDVFSWTVYVVNRAVEKTNARPPRKLALVAVPKRRRTDAPRPAAAVHAPSSTGIGSGPRRRGEKDVADAVLDENVLHALQKNAAVEPADLICLSADTRVGPVPPGACHVVELQFLALREGVVSLEAIRVVDLGSQEHVDIRDLPTMIVEPVAA